MNTTKFIPTLQTGNGYTHLKLKGILDEDNVLVNLLSQIQGHLLLIDMSEIERINSCGVRDWVNWLNQVQALGIEVILLRCSPVVVSQANMVANFAADAFIHSFFAPYVNPNTDEDINKLILTEEIRKNIPIKAPKFFTSSGEELELDEFEDSYFAFLNDPKILNYQLSPEVNAIIGQYMPELNASHSLSGMGPASSDSAPLIKPSQPIRHSQPPLPDANYQPAPSKVSNSTESTQVQSESSKSTEANPKSQSEEFILEPIKKRGSVPSADHNAEPAQDPSEPKLKSHVLSQDNQETLPLSSGDTQKKKLIIRISLGIIACLVIILILVIFLR